MGGNCKVFVMLWSILILGGSVFAFDAPVLPGLEDVRGPIDLSTGKLKNMPARFPELKRSDAIAYTGQPLPLSKAADVCEDYRSRGFRWYFGGTIFDGAVYFAYQDMETVCSSPYTMEVANAWWAMVTHGAAGTAQFHAEIWSVDLTDPSCPAPGSPVYIGPTVAFSIPAGVAGIAIQVPLASSPYDIACVDGPYFIAVVCGPQSSGVALGAWGSDDQTTPQFCVWYWQNVVDGTISDFSGYFWDGVSTLDLNLSSLATTTDQNDCHLPGVCGWNYYHCGYVAGISDFAMPSTSGTRDFVWSKFNASSPCTVLRVDVYAGAVRVGDPGFRISIFDNDGGYPGNEIVGEDFASGAGWKSAYFLADQPVIVPTGDYYVYVGRASWATDADTCGVAIAPPGTCDIVCGSGVTGNTGVEQYFCDLYGAGSEYNMVAEVYTCCAQPKTCEPEAGVDDDWNTHAHDYARTSHSLMALGDSPCDIALNWHNVTTRADARFNNVTAAGGKVFCSDDQAVYCFDLAYGTDDGTPGGTLGPLWIYYDPAGVATASALRNNITVTGGYCYGGGGTARSFFKLDTAAVDVSPADGIQDYAWSRHYNSMGHGTGDWLGGNVRFAVSVVVGTKVVVGDESGRLWCFNTADGTNHTDWSTNPAVLSGAIMHGPAYDGAGNLYVGTSTGRVYKVLLSNGTATLLFTEPDAGGFTGGLSYDADDDVLYGACIGASPKRYKLATDGTVLAVGPLGSGTVSAGYGTPTIGNKKVLFPMDYPNAGLAVVDKFSWAIEYNFQIDGVGQASNPATETADCYAFVGDRQGGWHLVNSQTSERIWSRYFQDFVWGTALIHHNLEDKDYAVMSIWSDITTGYANGGVFCWELNAAPRPMLEQYTTEVNIPVPFGSGYPNPGAAPDAFANLSGCGPLTISALNVYDDDPTALSDVKGRVTHGNPKTATLAGKTADQLAGDDYLSFFNESRAAKQAKMNGVTEDADQEAIGRHQSKLRFDEASKRSTSLAAGAATLRTFNVATDVASPIAGGTSFGFTWDWDGTGLERSVSTDFIEVVSDDPDFYPELVGYGYYPGITINYVGGCLYEWFEHMYFNGYEMWHLEQVSNYGRTGDGTGYGLDWGDGHHEAMIYDGGFVIAQVGGDYAFTTIYDRTDMEDRLLPNPAPFSGVCGVDYDDSQTFGRSVVFDWDGGGSCPPVLDVDYLELGGEISWVSYIDSNATAAFSLGTEITQMEICFYDFGSGYGDLKLFEFKIEERNGDVVPDLVAGMFHDWDVEDNSSRNGVTIVPEVGAYAVWDTGAPDKAFGHMVLGAAPSLTNSAHVEGAEYRALVGCANGYSVYSTTCVQCCFNSDPEWMDCIDNYWFGAFIEPDEDNGSSANGDMSGIFLFPQFDLPALGEVHFYAALFGVDASSDDRPTIEENIRSMAFRANKIAGFNRGDVNDDDGIDAIDVAYLYGVVNGSGWPVFPYDDTESISGGNGDVDGSGVTDGADVTYLMNYLMGGPAPVGVWRFGLMP